MGAAGELHGELDAVTAGRVPAPSALPAEPVAAADALWLDLAAANNLPIITALFELERTPSVEVLTRIATQLASAPLLRRRVVRARGRWRWQPAVPDLRAHVEVRECTDWQQELARILATDLDLARPLWKIYLLQAPDQVVLVVRLHHALGDGSTLVGALLHLAGAREPALSRPRSGRLRALLDVPAAAARLLARRAEPRTLKSPLSGVKHARITAPFPLAELKTAAQARGVTLNDLLAGALGSALSATLPGRPSLTAAAPVSLRRRTLGGNRFGIVLLALPAGDVEASVRAAASYLRRLKRSGEAVAVNLAFRAATVAPKGLVRLLSALLGRRASLVFSNVVGPTGPVRLAGIAVRDLSFLVPQVSSIGLGVSALSYAGQVRVGFSADAATVPDLDALVAAFTERVRQLLASAAQRL